MEMEIGLDELYREQTRGEWHLRAFWLPPVFWRHLMADHGATLRDIHDVMDVVRHFHLFLVSGVRRRSDGSVQPLPTARLRSCLSLRDTDGTEQRVLKTKLPAPMKTLVYSLATTVNSGEPHTFVPLIFPAAAADEFSMLFPRVRGELVLIARSLADEEITLQWPVIPSLPEPPRPRPRRSGELRRA